MMRTAIALGLGVVIATSAAASADSQPSKQELAFVKYHCDRKLVICYDRDGELFEYTSTTGKRIAELLPDQVDTGDIVTVVVLTRHDDIDEANISVAFQGKKLQEVAFDRAMPQNLGAADRSTSELEFSGITFRSDPVAEDILDLAIGFHRAATGAERPSDSQLTIPVNHGYSYYSVALLVAATFKGDRHVLRDLETTSDHAIDPGLALNIFPFGRERGRIGYIRSCGPGPLRLRRCLADMIGFQLATDLDLRDPTDKLYAGLVFEPVAGLALSGGVSLRKVAVVPAPGALPATEAMTGAALADLRYVLRGYVAVTMTFDLLDTISSMGTKIRNVKLPE